MILTLLPAEGDPTQQGFSQSKAVGLRGAAARVPGARLPSGGTRVCTRLLASSC